MSAGAVVTVAGAVRTYVNPANAAVPRLRLSGGSLTAASLVLADPSHLVWTGGTLTLTGTAPLAVGTAGSFPDGLSLASGMGLSTGGPLSVAAGAALNLSGGATVTAADLSVGAEGGVGLGNGTSLTLTGGSVDALSRLTALATSGLAGGAWTGPGIEGTAAAADASHLSAVGVAAVGSTVVALATVYGDANLDGAVTAADYTRLDAGYVLRLTGWSNGDFNYDGVVDGSDYTLADNAFNRQGTGLFAAANAALVAAVPEPAGGFVGAVVLLLGRSAPRRSRFAPPPKDRGDKRV